MPFEPSFTDHSAAAMTPAEPTEKLAAIETARNPAPPIAPQTPSDARRRLDVLIADREFGERLFAGNAEAKNEFDRLQQLAASANIPPPSKQLFHTTTDGQLPPRAVASYVADLRDLGFGDTAIGEALSGKKFSAEEVFLAKSLKSRAFRDGEFTKALEAGNPVAVRNWKVWNAIIVAGVEDAPTK